jgi:hypothetical protein
LLYTVAQTHPSADASQNAVPARSRRRSQRCATGSYGIDPPQQLREAEPAVGDHDEQLVGAVVAGDPEARVAHAEGPDQLDIHV